MSSSSGQRTAVSEQQADSKQPQAISKRLAVSEQHKAQLPAERCPLAARSRLIADGLLLAAC
jgi:hypothetical protein